MKNYKITGLVFGLVLAVATIAVKALLGEPLSVRLVVSGIVAGIVGGVAYMAYSTYVANRKNNS